MSRFLELHDGPSRQRRAQIAFHVRAGDYFGTLASILRLLEEQLGHHTTETRREILQRLHEDLDYLQQHYHVSRKKERTEGL